MSRTDATGLAPERLQHLDRVLQAKYLDSGKLPCALTLIERRGRIAHFSDTEFFVPASKATRLAACYTATSDGRMALQDDPRTSPYLKPPGFVSGGGGLVSTAPDYLRFCRMLLNGGTLDGARILSPKTLQLMSSNHLPGGKELPDLSVSAFSESMYAGVGFGLGFATTMDVARTLLPGSPGDLSWGGMASTYFWVDPREQLIAVFMTQLMPSTAYPLRRDLRTLVYSAFA